MPNLIDPYGAGNAGPGWPMLNSETQDGRPTYSPGAVVFDIVDALAKVGIRPELTPGQLHTARIAAADLLRALGVRPVNVPERS